MEPTPLAMNTGTSKDDAAGRAECLSVAAADAAVASHPVYTLVATRFDPVYYANQVGDRGSSPSQLLLDYVTHGWREGKNPSAHFSAEKYLARYPDVAAAGFEPLSHYLLHGCNEARSVFAVDGSADPAGAEDPGQPASEMHSEQRRRMLAYFDGEFYLRANSDVAAAGDDALSHYMEFGWKEGRDPSPHFSTAYYLASNPDVACADMPPLLHYATTGHAEGRLTMNPGGWRADMLARSASLQERALAWARPPGELLDPGELDAVLEKALARLPSKRCVVAVGHDRYYENVGGIQACEQEEQARLNEAGYAYIFVNPYQPLPTLSSVDSRGWLCDVSVDGKLAGTLAGDDVLSVVARQLSGSENYLQVHSLLGHDPSWIETLSTSVRFVASYFWVHDFFTVCPSFNLLRNDVSFCDAPPVESNSCSLCTYGDERRRHLVRIHSLFKRVPFTVLAPSRSALALWRAKAALPHLQARSVPHRTLVPIGPERVATGSRSGGPVRVAFLGLPAPHKGWFIFKDLVKALQRDERYEFFHLGLAPDASLAVTHVPVRSSRDAPDAMQAAIRKWGIDIALILSVSPETFCFTAHEACAGGSSVFAFECSGNVADMVRETGAGKVFGGYADLLKSFRDGAAARDALGRRRPGTTSFKYVPSATTAAAIIGAGPLDQAASHVK